MPGCSLKWAFSPRLHPPTLNVSGIWVSSLTSRMPLHVLSFTLLVSQWSLPPSSPCVSSLFPKSFALSFPLSFSLRFQHSWCHLFLLFVSISCLFCSHTALQANQKGKQPLQRSATPLHIWHWWIENIFTTQFLLPRLPTHHCKDNCLIPWQAYFVDPSHMGCRFVLLLSNFTVFFLWKASLCSTITLSINKLRWNERSWLVHCAGVLYYEFPVTSYGCSDAKLQYLIQSYSWLCYQCSFHSGKTIPAWSNKGFIWEQDSESTSHWYDPHCGIKGS